MKFRLYTVRDFYTKREREKLEGLNLGFEFQSLGIDETLLGKEEFWEISNEPEIELMTIDDLTALIHKIGKSVIIGTDLPPRLGIVNDYF